MCGGWRGFDSSRLFGLSRSGNKMDKTDLDLPTLTAAALVGTVAGLACSCLSATS
jgi:hypothetical protein